MILLAALTLGALAAAPAAAESPWWAVDVGSRPSNLRAAPSQSAEQQVETEKANMPVSGEVLISPIAVGGIPVGCLGSGNYFSGGLETADQLCEAETGFLATETPAALGELLEAHYGVEVQLAGPAGFGEGDIVLTTPGNWVPPLEFGPPVIRPSAILERDVTLGNASAEVTSEGSGRLVITATNLGDAPLDATSTPLTITDELPEGVFAYGAEGFAGVVVGGVGTAGEVRCELPSTALASCAFEGELPPYEAIEVEVDVALALGAGAEPGEVALSGGDGPDASAAQGFNLSAEPVEFGIEGFSMRAEEEGGATTSRAGAHPFQLSQSLRFNSGPMTLKSGGRAENPIVEQPAQPRDVRVKLPPGLVGNPSPIPTCSFAQFITQEELVNECAPETAVGAASVTVNEPVSLGFTRVAVPVFNLEPAYGEPARLGFMAAGVPVTIDTELRGSEAYAIGANVLGASQLAQVLASTVSIWGNPGDPRHDSSRGWGCLYWSHPYPCERPAGVSEAAFLRMPVSCEEPVSYGIEVEPWNTPPGSRVAGAVDESPALLGCGLLPFDPRVEATPTTRLAASPSGLDFSLQMPNHGLEDPEGRSEAQPREIEVALPEGMTANPSLAESLATCSQAQLARESAGSEPGEGCPQAAKIGTVELETPLLEGRLLKGSVYAATPYENPAGSLLALYLTVREPRAGVLVTQTLEVRPDPDTGQLLTVAEEVPQLPFSRLDVHLRSGGRPPLISPPRCGELRTKTTFHPYSVARPVVVSSGAEILAGPRGGPCPAGAPPFGPGFEAGSLSAAAGSYAPFYMRLTRQDGEQDMTRFSAVLPRGVLGRLAGLGKCPESGIARAKSRTGPHGAAEEIADPSCPASSRIGRTLAGAGAGNQLTHVPGSLYLAGPYNGDPLSVVAITPAKAGPFDVGAVVVREALALNPRTAQVEVDGAASDPIPHILKGIPLSLRDLRVYADRPGFTLNPTSCAQSSTGATLFGSNLDLLDPADDVPVGLASPYQAVNCAGLGFKPRLGLKLRGKPRRGGFPALRAHYRPGRGGANLRRLALTFPSSAFIEQGHFRTICTRVRFAAGQGFGSQCPKGSIYGRARVWTPLLEEPLTGPVYLRSSNHNLPDAVFALRGPPSTAIEIEVAVRIDSVNGRLRATVEKAPDAPVSRAIVDMQGGQKGLFVNSRNLCFKPGRNRARANLRGQNGRLSRTRPVVRAAGCAKKRGAKRASVSGARVADRPGGRG